MKFSGIKHEIITSLTINNHNIENPTRSCNCNVGGNLGFCTHFWVAFIFSLKKEYFQVSNWKVTPLPDDFQEIIKKIDVVAKKIDV